MKLSLPSNDHRHKEVEKGGEEYKVGYNMLRVITHYAVF